MDRKTGLCTVFVIGVAGLVGWWTLGDSNLRALTLRTCRELVWSTPPPVADPTPVPPPQVRPVGLQARFDPDLSVPSQPRCSGRSYEGDLVPYAGWGDAGVEGVSYGIYASPDGVLTVAVQLGDWSCYLWFRSRLTRSDSTELAAKIEGRSWIDLRPAVGWPDPDERLHDIAGEITIDSLDWTPGRTIAVRLDLDFNLRGEPEQWCQLVTEGAATIEVAQGQPLLPVR